MNPEDPVITRVSATNPVPDPDALTTQQRIEAAALRAAITAQGAGRPRPTKPPRHLRHGVLAAATVIPVAIVVILALGIHHRPSGAVGGHGSSQLQLPSPGSAQTLLLIGSDHRAGAPFSAANTDALMLVRLDPDARTIHLLSVPRDLEVRIPDGSGSSVGKLNSAYSAGGPSLVLTILKTQVFPGLAVNHIIDLNFQGFAAAVDALGCVYGDIDHRYVNDTARTDYSSIDLQAGYQKLCGSQALQFVRFRHTDSDLVRQARAQDLLRWLGDKLSVGELIAKRDQLFQILGRNSETDDGLHSVSGLIQLFDLVMNSSGHPLQQIPFPAVVRPCDRGACYLSASKAAEAQAYQQFLSTGVATSRPGSSSSASSANAAVGARVARVTADAASGQSQATALGDPGLPIYYPALIAAGSSYCSSTTGNCRVAPNDASRYANAYPRAYTINAGVGHGYRSYRMTLVLNAALCQYYGVQGTTWSDPPILRHPIRTQVLNGRLLREYGTDTQLSVVAFSTSTGTYWVSNTPTNSIPSAELVAIAASMRPAA
jgi:LCP family protein required for cell wall assembly